MKLTFKIEQVAIVPPEPAAALKLLTEMGLGSWSLDNVSASGFVFGAPAVSKAELAFNYDSPHTKPLEFEVLHYTEGANWMDKHGPSASHLGMHVSSEELIAWRQFFAERGIEVAQEVFTHEHTNPVIAGKRFYTYVIFNTRPILGIDCKFIVRRDVA